MELGLNSANNIIKPFRAGLDLRMLDDEDLDRLEQVCSECVLVVWHFLSFVAMVTQDFLIGREDSS